MNVGGRIAAALALALVVGNLTQADDAKKIDQAKLIGTWKIVKAEGAPEGATVEFTKDGKMIVSAEMNGQKLKFEGTYKIEGDKLLSAMTIMGNEVKDTDTIKSLTDDKLTLVDKEGKLAELEKVKKK